MSLLRLLQSQEWWKWRWYNPFIATELQRLTLQVAFCWKQKPMFCISDELCNGELLCQSSVLFWGFFCGQCKYLWQNTRRQMSDSGRANTTRSLRRAKQLGSKVRQRGFESVVFTFFFLRHFTSNLCSRNQEEKGWKGPGDSGADAPTSEWRLRSQTYLDNNCSQLGQVWGGGPEGLWLERVIQPLHDLWLLSVCHNSFFLDVQRERQDDWGKTSRV